MSAIDTLVGRDASIDGVHLRQQASALCMALMMVLSVAAIGVGPVSAQSSTTIEFQDPGDIDAGDSESADLVATNVPGGTGVGAYQMNVSYNTSNVSLSIDDTSRFTVDHEVREETNGVRTVTIVGYTGETSTTGTEHDTPLADITVTGTRGGVTEALTVESVETFADVDGNEIDHIIGDPASFTVSEPDNPFFSVSIDQIDDTVTRGNQLTVVADVDNTGGQQGTQDVTFDFNQDGVDITESVTLSSGSSEEVTFTYDVPSGASTGDTTVEVSSLDDSDTATVRVQSSGGGGGGGGGGGAPPDDDGPDITPPAPPAGAEVLVEETVGFTDDPDTGASTASFSQESAVESVSFGFSVSGGVNARTLDGEPDETGPAPGASVAVTQITVPDVVENSDATVRMRVSKERLNEIDADAGDLRINRFADGEWQGLETDVIGETDTHVRIEAETPGFSYFAASAVSEPEAAASVSSETVEPGEEIELSGAESTDQYGEIVAYDWSVAGETLTGETVTTAVDEAGTVEAELTVTNDAGETDTTTVSFTVEEPTGDGTDDGTDDGTGDGTDDGPTEEPGGLPVFALILVLFVLAAVIVIALYARREE